MADLLPKVTGLGKKIPTAFLRLNSKAPRLGGLVNLKSTVTDSGNGLSRTSYLRPGLLIVKNASDKLFYRADGSTGDRNTGAAVTALIVGAASWDSKTISSYVNGRLVKTVTLGGADDTTDKHVTALMADTDFARDLVATNVGGFLVITTLETGANVLLKVTSNLATAYGASGLFAIGGDADYRVLGENGGIEEWVDMLDQSGTAFNASGRTLLAGDFVKANLIGDTATQGVNEAFAVLVRRGSSFA